MRRLLFVLVVVVACTTPVSTPSSTSTTTTTQEPQPEPTPPSTATIEAGSWSIQLPAGLFPIDAAFDGERYWVLAGPEAQERGAAPADDATLLAIDSITGEISVELSLSDAPVLVIADEVSVWVAHHATGSVTRIDPAGGDVAAVVELQLPSDVGAAPDLNQFVPNDLEIGGGFVWVSTARGAVARIATSDNAVEVIGLSPPFPSQVAISNDAIWVAEDVQGLTRIDLSTNTISTISLEELDHAAQRVASIDRDVYVAGDRLGRTSEGGFATENGGFTPGDQYTVSRIDPETMMVIGSSEFDHAIVTLGWVNAFFGALDETGMFWHLSAIPLLVDQANETNWSATHPVAQLGRDVWMIANRTGRLLRVDELRSASVTLPFEIPDGRHERPVSPEAALSPDWIALDRGPLDPRWPGVMAWTGDEIVIWGGEPVGGGTPIGGGAAYRPATDTWRELSDSPLVPPSAPGSVWTGTELIIWNSGAAAAWQPGDNTWRSLEDWPLKASFYRLAVWTGEVILDAERALLIDPVTGQSRPIAEPPYFHQRASVVWANGDLVVVTSEGAYNLETNTWVEMPRSGLTPLATAGAWTGTEVVAVDYGMNAAGYDPQTNTWKSYPSLPLRFSECSPQVHTLDSRPVAEHCTGIGIWDPDRQSWIPLAHPRARGNSQLISTGEQLYAWGGGFYRLDPASVTDPKRLAVGISLFDIPGGWTLASTAGGAGSEAIQVNVEAATGETCRIHAIHAESSAVLASYLKKNATVTDFTPNVGGNPVTAIQVTIDGQAHLVWAVGTTDIVDVGCTDAATSGFIATYIWAPNQ